MAINILNYIIKYGHGTARFHGFWNYGDKSHSLAAILDRKSHLFRLTRNFTDMFHDTVESRI